MLYARVSAGSRPGERRERAGLGHHKKPIWCRHQDDANGRHMSISMGIRVRAASKATIIATAVNIPNRTVGMKFDMIRIEKPTVIVKVV